MICRSRDVFIAVCKNDRWSSDLDQWVGLITVILSLRVQKPTRPSMAFLVQYIAALLLSPHRSFRPGSTICERMPETEFVLVWHACNVNGRKEVTRI